MYNKFSEQYIGTTYSINNLMTWDALQWCELLKLLSNDVKSETNPIEWLLET